MKLHGRVVFGVFNPDPNLWVLVDLEAGETLDVYDPQLLGLPVAPGEWDTVDWSWFGLDTDGASAAAGPNVSSRACTCDFYAVILPMGCQCGGV